MDTRYTTAIAPTGRDLFILILSAEASLTNGFRYMKDLLMQHHNFYLNKCWKMLTEEGVGVYTVKRDAFTIQQARVDEARDLLNWEEGIGSWKLNKNKHIKFPMDEPLMSLKENKLIELH